LLNFKVYVAATS